MLNIFRIINIQAVLAFIIIIGALALYTSICYGIATSALLISPIIFCPFVMIKEES